MEDGLLSLKWNNHKTTFFHTLSILRKKQTYTDATIACEGKFFPVHKLVMSTCSDYFSEIFDKTPCKAPVVVLKDIRHADLEALLNYMYLGEVDVKQSELAGLIKAAECLRIKGLAVPDEDPSTPKKASHVPERQSSPSSKRRRRSSGLDDSSYSHKSSRLHSPNRSHSSSTSVPSQPPSGDSLSQVPSYQERRHSSGPSQSNSVHEPEIVAVDMIKVEVEDDPEQNQQDQSHLLDHSSADDPGDDCGDLDDGSNSLSDKKDQLANNFSDFGDSRDIEKEEIEQMDPYDDSDTLPGPSGVQGSQMSQWGQDEASFPQNLFGNEDPSQQQQVLQRGKEKFSSSSFLHLPLPGSSFSRAESFEEDLASATPVSRNESRFVCPYCLRVCQSANILTEHVRTHTGEKPYSCSDCSYTCSKKSNLFRHIRFMHPNKCYVCRHCTFSAVSPSHLAKHISKKHFIV